MADLQRFKDAQEETGDGFDEALSEIRSGRKTGHWIWYVFPQLRGLGRSAMSEEYGIAGESEALAYLRDPQLRSRLLAITTALAAHRRSTVRLGTVMGSQLDAAKVVSSMTLFAHAARRLRDEEGCTDCQAIARSAESVLAWGAEEGLPACAYTRSRLSEDHRDA
jgi:uncharacterized protein (DUF1810 family)